MRDFHFEDRIFFWILRLVGVLTMALLGAIIYKVYEGSIPAIHQFGWGFFFGTNWNPVTDEFGAGAFIYGTLVSSLLALLIAVPLSLGVALFLAEVAYGRVARIVGFMVEMLAAIPSVVYGLWGIFVLAPWLRNSVQPMLSEKFGFLPLFQGPPLGVGMLASGIILAIMITPTVSTVCREIFRSISRNQREAALALGSTKWEMMKLSVLESSRAGIFGAVVLGFGRAFGETMAVTMVIGNRGVISASLFSPAQTMASLIANEYAEATSDMHLSALSMVGLALFLVSLVINASARLIVMNVKRSNA